MKVSNLPKAQLVKVEAGFKLWLSGSQSPCFQSLWLQWLGQKFLFHCQKELSPWESGDMNLSPHSGTNWLWPWAQYLTSITLSILSVSSMQSLRDAGWWGPLCLLSSLSSERNASLLLTSILPRCKVAKKCTPSLRVCLPLEQGPIFWGAS